MISMYRRRMGRRRMRPRIKSSSTHVPATIGTVPGANIATIILAAVPSQVAGVAATTDVEARDRDRTCAIGSHVNSIVFDIALRGAPTTGYVEYAVFKLERQTAVPTLGVVSMPTSATITTIGLQQAMRTANPGRIVKFGQIPYTAETTRVARISANFKKYRLSSVRQGDYFGIVIYNRTGTVTFDVQMRYKEILS